MNKSEPTAPLEITPAGISVELSKLKEDGFPYAGREDHPWFKGKHLHISYDFDRRSVQENGVHHFRIVCKLEN